MQCGNRKVRRDSKTFLCLAFLRSVFLRLHMYVSTFICLAFLHIRKICLADFRIHKFAITKYKPK